MEWTLKALLTAAAVLAAIGAARRCERAVGGAIAGLPIVTAPWLVGMAAGQGAEAAAQAAIASVAACAVLAAFASGYAWAACSGRGRGIGGATVVALMSAMVVAPIAARATGRLDLAVVLATVGCTIALRTWPTRPTRGVDRRVGIELPLVAASAGAIGASSGAAASWLGGFGASVFTALPVVGFGTALIAHRTGGPVAAAHCLHGYLAGLYGRIAFGLVFAVTVVSWGTVASLAAATSAGCATTFVVVRRIARRRCDASEPAGTAPPSGALTVDAQRRLVADPWLLAGDQVGDVAAMPDHDHHAHDHDGADVHVDADEQRVVERREHRRGDRGQRRVAQEEDDDEPGQRRRETQPPLQREQDAERGGDALAALDPEEDRIEMADERGNGHRGDAGVVDSEARTELDREPHREPTLRRVEQQRGGCGLPIAAAKHVGRAGVARAEGARVREAGDAADDDRERDRAEQVGRENGDGGGQRSVHGIVAFGLAFSRRSAARNARGRPRAVRGGCAARGRADTRVVRR